MVGVIVNTLAVVFGGALGLLLKKGIPERVSSAVMKGIGLCSIYIGISGALEGEKTLVLVLSMAIGGAIGELLDLDRRLSGLAGRLGERFKGGGSAASFAEGFVSASLLFCVGAMTIVGSLQSGLNGDHSLIFTKSTMDFISAIIFASSLGVGVLFSGAFVLLFQGAIVLVSGFAAPYLSDVVIAEMTCAGSLLIFAIGINLLGIGKIKVMNYLPCIFLPILFCLFM